MNASSPIDSRPRILIVDDDPAVREILGAVLAREGWTADGAADVDQAIAHLEQTRYAAIVLDLLLPRVDGSAVITYIRERGLSTPVVVVSAVSHDRGHELDPHVVRVTLQKPFEIGELRTVLRAVVDAVARRQ